MKATKSETPVICPACGADEMGCTVKAGLSGRRCCDRCSHEPTETKCEISISVSTAITSRTYT